MDPLLFPLEMDPSMMFMGVTCSSAAQVYKAVPRTMESQQSIQKKHECGATAKPTFITTRKKGNRTGKLSQDLR